MKLYTATSLAHDDEQDQKPHEFVSLDGDRWLEMNRRATAEDYSAVVDQFAVRIEKDEDGFAHRRHHITIGTGYLRAWARECTFHEPIEVTTA